MSELTVRQIRAALAGLPDEAGVVVERHVHPSGPMPPAGTKFTISSGDRDRVGLSVRVEPGRLVIREDCYPKYLFSAGPFPCAAAPVCGPIFAEKG